MTRRVALLVLLCLAAGACTGEGTPLITTSTVTTSTVAPTTTVDTGPLAAFVGTSVEDPFHGSGFHEMQYGDATRSFLLSVDSLTGADPALDRLAIAALDPAPLTSGTGANQHLVAVWVDNTSEEIPPSGVALYTLGPAGWELYVNVDARAVLGFLETTTDYDARRPGGTPAPTIQVASFDWTGSAHFVADVAVYDLGDVTATDPAFAGRVECDLADILECALLSDDGVLRPGDLGEAVEELQQDLIALGYLAPPSDGVYDAATEHAVTAFQRDYRLTRDGKAGPQTLTLLESVSAGESEIVLASREGVGEIEFGMEWAGALDALEDFFGSPDTDTGWYDNLCDGHQWREVTWDGFRVYFTDRSGSRRFDGWHVDDLADVPGWLYFAGGIRPGTTWAYLEDLGATLDGSPWSLSEFGYPNGTFTTTPSGEGPPDDAVVRSFGTGTGGFISC